MPLIYFILTNSLLPTLALCLIAALVVFKHRANIERLRAGIEPKIGAKAKE
jgi:glycerol-3-phosphate acyltransferase PlsY